jgi:colicin import membrane protein
MRQSPDISKEPSLQKIVIASAILHFLFITLVVIPFRTRERELESYFVNLVGPIEVHREVKSTTLVKKRKKRRVIPKKRIAAIQRTREQEAIDRVAREIERIRAIKALSERKRQREKAREIEIVKKRVYEDFSEGSPEKETYGNLNFYYALITRKIWSHWVYPDFESTGLEVIVSIKIDRDGRIVSHQIEKSSGNVLFDRSAIKALSKASPLPPPPKEMEIGVRFHL